MPTAAGNGPGRSDKASGQDRAPNHHRHSARARTSSAYRRAMNTSSLVESVKDRFPDAVSASHTYRGDATVILRRAFLLDVARFLKIDPALQMNYLMDLTAVDYSTFGKRPAPAFFSSSGVAVGP